MIWKAWAIGAGGAWLAYVAPLAFKRVAIGRLRRRCVRERVLVLTYDDGPGPRTTERLLELLDEYDARATFFMSGSRIEEHADVAREVHDRGHDVASHAFDHRHAWKSDPVALGRDMERGLTAARGAAPGRDDISFRPPFGKLVLPTWLQARARGISLAWWTDDSGDSFDELPAISPALDLLDRGGGVALLHDLDRSEPRNEFVLATTRALLEGARERGMGVRTMRELFDASES